MAWRLTIQIGDNIFFEDYDTEDDANDALDRIPDDGWTIDGRHYKGATMIWSKIEEVLEE